VETISTSTSRRTSRLRTRVEPTYARCMSPS
jgi:hypothetical protein